MAKKIKVCKDGPYLVTGNVPLREEIIGVDSEGTSDKWIEGKKFPDQDQYTLCRCGKSTNKPYCSGGHTVTQFDSTETADNKSFEEKAEVIKGPGIDLKDAEELCARARFCDRAQGVWQATLESDDEEAKKLVIEESCNCPSGRLVACEKSGKPIEPKLNQEISTIEDPAMTSSGPLWVKGGIPVESADGKEYQARNRVTLCRCGKSKNKPFCDASHVEK